MKLPIVDYLSGDMNILFSEFFGGKRIKTLKQKCCNGLEKLKLCLLALAILITFVIGLFAGCVPP